MTWTAQIVSKDYQKGVLLIGMEYRNETEWFTESIDLTGGSSEVLDQKIQNRLAALSAADNLAQDIDSAISAKESIELKPVLDDTGITVAKDI